MCTGVDFIFYNQQFFRIFCFGNLILTFTLHGIPASRGIVIGNVHLVSISKVDVSHRFIDNNDLEKEANRFLNSQRKVLEELATLRQNFPLGRTEDLDALIDLHGLLLKDSMLTDAVLSMIREHRCNAEWALTQYMLIVLNQFDKVEDEYLKQRKRDVEQVTQWLLKGLVGEPIMMALPQRSELSDQATIVVAEDVAPADVLQFHQLYLGGFVTTSGGGASHTAIAARSLGIPAVVGVPQVCHLLKCGDFIILDGELGIVVVNPSEQIYHQYKQLQAKINQDECYFRSFKNIPTKTLDNHTVKLLANIDFPADVESACSNGADGVGLLRTEFLFMSRKDMPDENEQYQAYLQIIASMPGRPITIRTLDFGADKKVPSLLSKSRNGDSGTIMGLRAIRLCLVESHLFLTQLRAILRASAHGDVSILIPMLTHGCEIDQTLSLIQEAKKECDTKGFVYNRDIKIGAMIEVPAAAVAFPLFCDRFDFFSIGTNDLIQYTLAVNRTDSVVAHLYDPLHPAILHLITQVIKQAKVAGKSVSVCGEMAGDPTLTRLLLGLGLTEFSVHPNQLLSVKKQILNSNKGKIEKTVSALLHCFDSKAMRCVLDTLM